MAYCRRFVCNKCGFFIDAWDDGNPYIKDPDGVYHYFHHPGMEFQAFRIVQEIVGHKPTQDEVDYWIREHGGNRSDVICLECGHKFMTDLKREDGKCPECRSAHVVKLNHLKGQRCPKCKAGKFEIDPNFHAIS